MGSWKTKETHLYLSKPLALYATQTVGREHRVLTCLSPRDAVSQQISNKRPRY